MVISILIFEKNSICFVAEILAPWQHCPSGHRLLIAQVHATGEKRHRQEEDRRRQEQIKSEKTLCS
jgi:hypothetical protein